MVARAASRRPPRPEEASCARAGPARRPPIVPSRPRPARPCLSRARLPLPSPGPAACVGLGPSVDPRPGWGAPTPARPALAAPDPAGSGGGGGAAGAHGDPTAARPPEVCALEKRKSESRRPADLRIESGRWAKGTRPSLPGRDRGLGLGDALCPRDAAVRGEKGPATLCRGRGGGRTMRFPVAIASPGAQEAPRNQLASLSLRQAAPWWRGRRAGWVLRAVGTERKTGK
nr:translation initiation factor IF-2 [Oryctolagus cuniculus]